MSEPATGTDHREEIKRLRRIEGQVRGIQRMIEQERYCIDVLTQIRSIQRALQRVNDGILERHMRHCVVEAVESGDVGVQDARIREILKVLERGR